MKTKQWHSVVDVKGNLIKAFTGNVPRIGDTLEIQGGNGTYRVVFVQWTLPENPDRNSCAVVTAEKINIVPPTQYRCAECGVWFNDVSDGEMIFGRLLCSYCAY